MCPASQGNTDKSKVMDQTPVHDVHNPDLLRIIPTHSRKLIEIGCSSGALARAFKQVSPDCDYVGIEVDPSYAEMAGRFCDQSLLLDVEKADEAFWASVADRDCWIFGDTLEHMRDPWRLLTQVRRVMPANGVVAACIPNMQHWSMQVRLCMGDLRYQPSGLMDRTHLRWFTRQTIHALFEQSGFRIESLQPRIFNEPSRDKYLPAIVNMALLAGADPDLAVKDALAMQYVVKATPI